MPTPESASSWWTAGRRELQLTQTSAGDGPGRPLSYESQTCSSMHARLRHQFLRHIDFYMLNIQTHSNDLHIVGDAQDVHKF